MEKAHFVRLLSILWELISCFTDQSADVIGDWLEGGGRGWGVLKETAVKMFFLSQPHSHGLSNV